MGNFLLFLLATAGLCHALMYSPLFSFLRKVDFLRSLLSCGFCTGFWVSLLIGFYLMGVTTILPVLAFAGSAFCGLFILIFKLIDKNL